MLAGDQVEVGVIGEPIGLVRRPQRLAHAAAVETAAHVGGHVGEQQVLVDRVPDRPLGEREPAADLPHRRVLVDQTAETGIERVMGHGCNLPEQLCLPRVRGRE